MNHTRRFRVGLTALLTLAAVVAWMRGSGPFLDSRPDEAPLRIAAKKVPPPVGSDSARRIFDAKGAERGKLVFHGKAKCATCHAPQALAGPGASIHAASVAGIDGLESLGKVAGHHKVRLELGLSEAETKDLIEYLRSL
jgi:mono/diheme cytochrome c family protein